MVLTNLENNFYNNLESYIKSKKQEVETDHSINKIKEYENTIKVLRNIFQVRQHKILLRTIQSTGEDKDGMTQEEINLFEDIKSLMESHKSRFETIIEKKTEKTKTKVLKKVKIVKNVPAYTGMDGILYGPFEPEQEKELPEAEVTFLIKAEMAKLG
jgi:DNA replication initiation complex subunit (GINS family)